jgi:hypothetical protein
LTSVAVTQDPTSALQLTTKQYVDGLVASGIHYHTPVRVESPTNLNATYNQPGGAGVGVGATLTNAGAQVALAIDGVTLSVNDRVLVYTQTNAIQNGVYVVTNVGSGSTNWILTRSSDTDTYGLTGSNTLGEGSTFFVQQGVTGAGETYTCNTSGVIVFGTTNITFVQISATQIYSAGTGLTLSGTTFSITNTGVANGSYGTASSVPTLAINAQGQVTSASNTSIAINANQVTSGILATTVGGTGLSSFTSGGAVYATSTSALTTGTLPVTAGGIGVTSLTGLAYGNGTSAFTAATAAQVVAVIGSTAVTNATNAANVAVTTGAATTNYLTFVTATTGNLPVLTNTNLTYNSSTSAITGGISGGTF